MADGSSGDSASAGYWSEEATWQDSVLSEPFALTVTEPQKVSQMLSSYVVYTVRSPVSPPEGVKRRYSDFDWLRAVLVARFHGLAVPLLPEKRAVGNQGDAFIADRMRGLDRWLKSVVANPYLRKDVTLGVFLTTVGSAEFEQAKRAVAQGAGSNPAENEGLSRWFGCLRAFPLPDDSETVIAELEAVATEAEGTAAATLEAVHRYWVASQGMTEALRGMSGRLTEYARVATDRAAALSDTLSPCREDLAGIGDGMSKAAEAWSGSRDLAMFSVNEVQLFLMDALAKEVQRSRGLLALLEVRKAAQDAYAKAWQNEDKLRFDHKSLQAKGREDQAAQLTPRIAAAERETRQMKERMEDVTKGAIMFESRAAAALRKQQLLAAFGQFTRLCMESSRKQGEVWRTFLDAAELDPAEMEKQAEAVLMMDKRSRPTIVPLPTGPDTKLRVGTAITMKVAGGFGSEDDEEDDEAPQDEPKDSDTANDGNEDANDFGAPPDDAEYEGIA